VRCTLDLSRADELDRSGILSASRWRGIARTAERQRREDWQRRVPCAVAINRDVTIARTSYAGVPPSEESGSSGRRPSSSSTACRSRSRTSWPGGRQRCDAGPEPRARYQMTPPATALDGRGMGRTTGRVCTWRPVRLWAVMVAGLLAGGGVGLAAAQAATAGLLVADGLCVGDLQQ